MGSYYQCSFPYRTKEASARPIRRLWCFLVRQEKVQDIFIRLVFGKKHTAPHSSGNANADSVSVYSDAAGQGMYANSRSIWTFGLVVVILLFSVNLDELTDTMTAVSGGGGGGERLQDPVRIIHKDQDIISAFCINSVSLSLNSQGTKC